MKLTNIQVLINKGNISVQMAKTVINPEYENFIRNRLQISIMPNFEGEQFITYSKAFAIPISTINALNSIDQNSLYGDLYETIYPIILDFAGQQEAEMLYARVILRIKLTLETNLIG